MDSRGPHIARICTPLGVILTVRSTKTLRFPARRLGSAGFPRLLLTWAGLVTTLQPEANQPGSNSANVPVMNVRHLIKVHPRGVLLAELRVFFIRP
jgi:hypothetical protein